MLDNLRKDFERYCEYWGYKPHPGLIHQLIVLFRSPGLWAIICHRFGFWVNSVFGEGYKNPFKVLFKSVYFFGKLFIVYLVKVDILVTADIGPGFFISNRGNAIIGVRRMGANCTIHYNITIGQGVDGIPPDLGENIWVGHDSIIYGAISIGSNTIIRPHTVLSKTLPGNMEVGGNPCRMLRRNIEAGPYQFSQ